MNKPSEGPFRACVGISVMILDRDGDVVADYLTEADANHFALAATHFDAMRQLLGKAEQPLLKDGGTHFIGLKISEVLAAIKASEKGAGDGRE